MADQEKYRDWIMNRRKLTEKELEELLDNILLSNPAGTVRGQSATEGHPAPEGQAGQEQANVDTGSTVSFVKDLAGQPRHDVLDSTEFAQRTANAAYNRQAQTEDWYTFYTNTLEKIHWVLGGFTFDRYQATDQTFSVDKAIFDVILAMLTDEEQRLLEKTVEALKNLNSDDKRVQIFNRETVSSQKGNFQVGVARPDGDSASLTIGCFYFTTQTEITNVLWVEFESNNTYFYKARQNVVLNVERYAKIRKKIADRLDKDTEEFVGEVPLK
jgi:hypothetical protein